MPGTACHDGGSKIEPRRVENRAPGGRKSRLGGVLEGLGGSWPLLGWSWPLLERSWAALAAIWGLSGALLGRSCADLGGSWGDLGRSGAGPGRSCAALGRSWRALGRSWASLGRFPAADRGAKTTQVARLSFSRRQRRDSYSKDRFEDRISDDFQVFVELARQSVKRRNYVNHIGFSPFQAFSQSSCELLGAPCENAKIARESASERPREPLNRGKLLEKVALEGRSGRQVAPSRSKKPLGGPFEAAKTSQVAQEGRSRGQSSESVERRRADGRLEGRVERVERAPWDGRARSAGM